MRLIVAHTGEAKMRQKTKRQLSTAEETIRDTRRAKRKRHLAEDKIHRLKKSGLKFRGR